uniref:F-box domain-containing protein n=1 Tax=Setaria viridis TaxID=4556 RepID=A0A4U6VMP9_SETVI|nr:hypothetical protein SEVIR_2G076500v2 [Setaria viridis]
MAPAPSKFSRPDTGSVVPPLPFDASYQIMLRLPAKDLWRLRAVSSLLSNPQFIAAHGARHPGPLIVVGEPRQVGRRNDVRLYIMNLRGGIVKQVHVTGDGPRNATQLISSQSQDGLVCILSDMGKRCRLLNPATGAVSALPEGLAEEHAAHEVAATGEYKVLRVLLGMPPATMSGPGWRAEWAAMRCGSERRDRHPRQTARRRQSSLAGRRSRISYTASGCSTPVLEAATAGTTRLSGGAAHGFDNDIPGTNRRGRWVREKRNGGDTSVVRGSAKSTSFLPVSPVARRGVAAERWCRARDSAGWGLGRRRGVGDD